MGRDSSVGIANRYGLDGPRIELVQTGPGARPASYTMRTGLFPGVKRPGRDVDHPSPSSVEVEERVELYLYSPSAPSWPVLGLTARMIVQRQSVGSRDDVNSGLSLEPLFRSQLCCPFPTWRLESFYVAMGVQF